jgi:hypothetical protein
MKPRGGLRRHLVENRPSRLPQDNAGFVIAHTSSDAEALAGKVRGPVVSAFGTVPSEVLFGVYGARRQKATRPSLVYSGDDTEA